MSVYIDPFPAGTTTSQPYGSSPNNGVNPRGGHTGRDSAVPIGTPIRAAKSGWITFAGPVTGEYYENAYWLTPMGGNCVALDCGADDYTFIYAHLSYWTVKVGDWVEQGQIIAYSGNSGTATTGPHTHTEALPPNWDWQNGTFGRVDPDTVFNARWDGISVSGDITITQEADMPALALTDVQARQLEYIASSQFKVDLYCGSTTEEKDARALFHKEALAQGVPWYGYDGKIPEQGRNTTSQGVDLGFADTRAEKLLQQIKSLEEVVKQLALGQGVTVDYKAIAKAVNDDAAARMKAL